MNIEESNHDWSVTIPVAQRSRLGITILAWGLFVAACLWFGNVLGNPGKASIGIFVIIASLFLLAVLQSVNAYFIGAGLRGQIVLSRDGFSVGNGWRGRKQYSWTDVARFGDMLVSPNDGSSTLRIGFFGNPPKEGMTEHFTEFPEELAIPQDRAVALLDYVRELPAAEREFLPKDLDACLSKVPALEARSERPDA
ncbi:hypothetical protein HH303_03850 [Rhodospirillaceae bacterium KN72]|uniref:Uncharacterized protein n=1 Tax=Pacificispira spongiicola TaxID=2729598 RepID=A0A7Y0HF48_9PROT|nr:hypothetical protein [Pacificispira spongiicola]NMM43597.1 hypothetical protein [Pacificispira spongiicola]